MSGDERAGTEARSRADSAGAPSAPATPAVHLAVVEHEHRADVRRLGDWLEAAGAELTIFRPYALAGRDAAAGTAPRRRIVEGRLPRSEEFDGLVVLGGSMGPADDAEHPWLPGARDLLAASAAGDFPSFAICLGGELLTVAAGAEVSQREVPQIGVFTAVRRPEAAADPIFSRLPPEFPAYLWHGLEMSVPAGAAHLVEGTDAPAQAYRLGEAWGTQFHPESTGEQLRLWGTLSGESEFPGARSLDAVAAKATAAEARVQEVMEPLAHAFVAYVRERGAGPAGSGRI